MIESLTYENTTWTKHDWSIGEPITEEKMDNIENGIAILASQIGGDASSVEIAYQVGTNGTNHPSSVWSARIPTVPKGRYLWTRFTFGNGTIGYAVSYMGMDGDGSSSSAGIVDVLANYCVSSDGTNPPSSGWSSSIPTLQKGRYLWTRLSFLDSAASTISTAYSVAYSGTDGEGGSGGGSGTDGRGVESIEEWYKLSADQQPPESWETSGWSTTPSFPTTDLPYLYSYTVFYYTDGTSYSGPAHLVGMRAQESGSTSARYYMLCEPDALTKVNGAITPPSVTVYGKRVVGTSSPENFSGYFTATYYYNDGTNVVDESSGSAVSVQTFSIPSDTASVVFNFYNDSRLRASDLLDTKTIVVAQNESGGTATDSSPLFVDVTTVTSDSITLPNNTQLKEGCLNIFMLQRGTLGNTNLRINGVYVRRTRGDYLAQQLPEKYILECYYNGSYLYALNLPAILV